MIKTISAVILVILLFAYILADSILYFGTHLFLNIISKYAVAYNLEINSLECNDVEFESLSSAYWYGCRGSVSMHSAGRKRNLLFDISRFNIHRDGIRTITASGNSLQLLIHHGDIPVERLKEEAVSSESTRGYFYAEYFRLPIRISLGNTKQQIIDLYNDLVMLAKTGKTSLPLSFNGQLTVLLGGHLNRVHVSLVDTYGINSIVLDEGDVKRLAENFNRKLTNAEIELIAQNPVRAPNMLKIKEYAEKKSKEEMEKNSNLDEDTLRHLIWSYKLTAEFGPEFAELVTDAHEKGNTGNSEQDKAKDINNNRLGRMHAVQGKPEEDLVKYARKGKVFNY